MVRLKCFDHQPKELSTSFPLIYSSVYDPAFRLPDVATDIRNDAFRDLLPSTSKCPSESQLSLLELVILHNSFCLIRFRPQVPPHILWSVSQLHAVDGRISSAAPCDLAGRFQNLAIKRPLYSVGIAHNLFRSS
jgi:hypothetical protein